MSAWSAGAHQPSVLSSCLGMDVRSLLIQHQATEFKWHSWLDSQGCVCPLDPLGKKFQTLAPGTSHWTAVTLWSTAGKLIITWQGEVSIWLKWLQLSLNIATSTWDTVLSPLNHSHSATQSSLASVNSLWTESLSPVIFHYKNHIFLAYSAFTCFPSGLRSPPNKAEWDLESE